METHRSVEIELDRNLSNRGFLLPTLPEEISTLTKKCIASLLSTNLLKIHLTKPQRDLEEPIQNYQQVTLGAHDLTNDFRKKYLVYKSVEANECLEPRQV